MIIDEAVHILLLRDATLKGLVKRRIRPIAMAQTDHLPSIGYFSGEADEQFDHFSGAAETRRVEFTFDIFGRTMLECKTIAKALRSVLHYRGTAKEADTATYLIEDVEIRLSKHNQDTDLSEPPDVGTEAPIKRLSSVFIILYRSTDAF